MDTSSSTDRAEWTAQARVYSGRPDPTWTVPAQTGEAVASRWEGLPAWDGPPSSPPLLGYRGMALRAPDGRKWTAFGRLVTHDAETREDEERAIERELIESAPVGLLPDFVSAGD